HTAPAAATRTATDMQTAAVIIDEMIPVGYSDEAIRTAIAQTPNVMPAVVDGRCGRPIDALRNAPVAPRDGRRLASTVMPIMIRTNGTPSWRPLRGSHDQTACSFVNSDWNIPRQRPAITVTVNDEKRPISATPSAGTMKRV